MHRLLILLPVLALLGLALGVPALAHTSRAALLAQTNPDERDTSETALPDAIGSDLGEETELREDGFLEDEDVDLIDNAIGPE